MVQSTPPSPAPSTDGRLTSESAMSPPVNTSHPRANLAINNGPPGYSHHPRTRYGAQVREANLHIGAYGQSPPYSQASLDVSYGGYAGSHEPNGVPYDGLSRDVSYSTRVPYTPEASPPTPCPPNDAITTRSGLTIKRAAPQKTLGVKIGRVQKKSRAQKRNSGSTIITKPLSEIAKEMPNIPVADIAAFVARTTDERLEETARNKKAGQIKRPMNAFMLYRKAYQEVAKTQCAQNNHQHVSKVCGAGWPMEPDHIHDLFNEWAKTERSNHQMAHPGYKFAPSKPKKNKRDDDEGSTAACSDADDSDWATSHGLRQRGGRSRRGDLSRMSETPSIAYDPYDGFDPVDVQALGAPYGTGLYAYPTPGPPHPLPYGQVDTQYNLGLHPHTASLNFIQGVASRTPSPGVDYSLHAPEEILGYSAYVGSLCREGEPAVEPPLDPAMQSGFQCAVFQGAPLESSLAPQQAWWPQLESGQEFELAMAGYEEGNAHDAYLKGKEEDWELEDLDETSQFESWITQTDRGHL